MMRNTVMNVCDLVSVSISSGQSLSPSVDLGGLRLFGIVMPSAWTTANLTFQMSQDGGVTWNNMYDTNGTEIVAQASTSRYIAFDPILFSGVQMLRLRSGTSSSAVAQGSDRVLQILLRTL